MCFMKELQLLCFQGGPDLGGTLARQWQHHPQLVCTVIQIFFQAQAACLQVCPDSIHLANEIHLFLIMMSMTFGTEY